MHFAEEQLAEIDSEFACCGREAHESPESCTGRPAALFHLLHHPFVNQVEELRHTAEQRDASFTQCAQQL